MTRKLKNSLHLQNEGVDYFYFHTIKAALSD